MSPASFSLHIYHGSHKICGEKYICDILKSNSLRNDENLNANTL